jgi:ubiquinone/menaquinone biosynthesis C-methylase UbiE
VELAQLPPGATVLDVATGRGAVLFPAAERVGPQGSVIGIDLSRVMIRETGLEVQQRGLHNVQLVRMDAENLDFPDATFDFVLSGFGLFFFPNFERALSEFRRVLKPLGRLGVTTWKESDERWKWYDELLAAYGAAVSFRTQALDRPKQLRAALRQAGFSDIQLKTEYAGIPFVDEAEWWDAQWSISARAGLERMTPEVLNHFRAAAFARLQALRRPDGFPVCYQANVSLAINRQESVAWRRLAHDLDVDDADELENETAPLNLERCASTVP